MIDLDAIRARDRDYDDVFEAQANMSKHIAHRLVAWPVADRRALLAYVDELLAERALIVQRAENAEAALVESDALLREMLAWKVAIECIAPELGGAIMTLARIDAHLARQP